jgi:2-polyprenyl-6-methoxyphenol hydroxylase-like FAD-dependent oxidoreductase
VSDEQSLVTLQLARADDCPTSSSALLAHVEQIDPRFGRLLVDARALGEPNRWASRRASGLEVESERAPPRWLAIGDALLTTPPHQGQGIAQIAEQATMLQEALGVGPSGLPEARDRLFAHARSRLLAATLADSLGAMREALSA